MNAYDAAAVLADIGAELQKVTSAPPLAEFVDITFWLEDGSSVDLIVDKPVTNLAERMHKLCRWFSARRGNKVDYIEVYSLGYRTHYVVPRLRSYARKVAA